MRHHLAISALLLLPSIAQAASPYQRYSKALGHTAAAAAVLHFSSENGEDCTGVFIGPNGEALTALHCVENCLLRAGATASEAVSFLTENKIKLPDQSFVTCPARVSANGAEVATSLQIRHVFGPGFLSPRDSLPKFLAQFPQKYAELLSEGFEGRGDLALIQVGVKSGCAPIGAVDLQAPQAVPVFNLSHALVYRVIDDHSFEPDLFMTMGETMLYTDGEASASPANFAAETLSAADLAYIKANSGPGTFLSSVDSTGGASGSPIFSLDGKVIGVLRLTFNGDGAGYRAWTAQGIDLSSFLADIHRLVPANAQCPSDSAGSAP